MQQLKCPFCFEMHDFNKERKCPNSSPKDNLQGNEEIPWQYIEQYDQVPPLPLVTVGFSEHGKSTYLAALTLILQDLDRILPGATYQPLDEYTVRKIETMRQEAITGHFPPRNEIAVPRPLFINVYGGQGTNCLTLYDVAGEIYDKIYEGENYNYIKSLRVVKNVLFMVSLKKLEEQKLRINDLLVRFIAGIQRLEQPVAGFNLIVVYTMGDLIINDGMLPTNVKEHYLNDRFRNVTRHDIEPEAIPDFSLDTYITELQQVSDSLKEYTRKYVPNGSAFVDLAQRNQIGLKFTITSSTGLPPVNNRNQQKEITRYCVLDPYFWALYLNKLPKPREIHLILDSSENTGRVYKDEIEEDKNKLLSLSKRLGVYGDVMTHFLGEIRPASIVGQAPPITQPDKPRPHLIGPVLESCDDRSLAVALVAGKILDLNDFTSTTWNNRLLLVAFGEEEYQPWHHEVTIRKGDNLSLVINQFRQLLLSDSTS